MSDFDPSSVVKHYFGKKQKLVPHYSHIFYPVGGLRTSIDDLSLYLQEIMSGFNGEGLLLSEEFYNILLAPQFNDEMLPEGFPLDETNHGIFWTYRDNLIGHTGGGLGVSSFMFFDKDSGIGKLFITNCELETNKKLLPQFIQIWQAMDEYQAN